jgi:DNA-binding response OmpR family regulator
VKIKILCIDDSKSVHVFLKDCVIDITSDFHSAYDGEEAIKVFNGNNVSDFDVIFLDWNMPKKNGPEVLAEFKRRNIKIPVIMMTSMDSIEDITRMLAQGVSEYVMKPFTRDIVLEKIASVLNQK